MPVRDNWHMADVDPDTDWTRYAQRIALAVYGTLTVLGVLEATSFDEASLSVHVVLITVIGIIDVAIGVLIVGIKELHTFFTH